MKQIKNITLAFLFIIVITSCEENDPPELVDDAQQEMIDALSKTWSTSSVLQDNNSVSGDWSDFRIQLTENMGYTSNSSTNEQKLIWPISGSYTFPDVDNPNKILRSDGVEINLSNVTETSATLSFQITGRSNGRSNSLIGEWVFILGI